jgi:hypothetical protein
MADDIQGGLDAAVPVKANPKGGVSPLGNITMDPTQTADLLKRMQQMVEERESPLAKVLSGLKDFSAAGSGGISGPTAAIQLRDEQKAKEAQELFNMRSQMAALRSAQGQQELLKKQYEGLNEPQGGTAPAAGGTAAGTSPIPGLTLQQFTAIKNDPYVQSQLETLAPNDYAGKLAIIRDAAKTEFGAAAKGKYEAAGNKQEAYTIPGIGKNGGDGTVMMTPNEKIRFDSTRTLPDGTVVPKTTPVIKATPTSVAPTPAVTPTGAPVAGGTNLGNMRPVGQSTGFQPPVSVDKDLARIDDNLKAYGDKGINTLSGVISRWAPPNENDTQALIKNAAQFLGIDPNQKIDLSNPAVRQAISTAIIKQEGNLSKIFATTKADVVKPTTTTAAAPSEEPKLRDYPNKAAYDSAMKLYEEKQKIPVAAAAKEAETAAEASGKSLEQLKVENDRANSTIAAAQRVIDLANDKKLNKVMGYMHGNSPTATALSAVPGFAASLVGQGEKFEDLVKTNVFNKDEIAAHQRLNTDATQLGIEYTANMFKGARLGIGLEKLGLKGKGVSADYLPEVNKLYATLAKDAAEFELKKNDAFAKWKGNDPMKTYSQFLDSPGYDDMRNKQRELLLSRYPGIVKAETVEDGQKTTKSGTKYRVVKE